MQLVSSSSSLELSSFGTAARYFSTRIKRLFTVSILADYPNLQMISLKSAPGFDSEDESISSGTCTMTESHPFSKGKLTKMGSTQRSFVSFASTFRGEIMNSTIGHVNWKSKRTGRSCSSQ